MEQRVNAIHRDGASEMLWLVEHPPLYTKGASAREEDWRGVSDFPVYQTGRGGRLTYHGPGQRVVYVMLDLGKRGRDLRYFVYMLEEWLIASLAVLGVVALRRAGRVGLWVLRPEKGRGFEDKIAAIGLRVRRFISYHGVCINIDCDLTHFAPIIPCGIADPRFGVTSLQDLGRSCSFAKLDAALRGEFARFFLNPSCWREENRRRKIIV